LRRYDQKGKYSHQQIGTTVKIVECVPNFSEGRRKDVVDALVAALTGAGAALLDCEMDAAHNRCVISIAGEPEAVAKGVLKAVGKAVEYIDLRRHTGEHPRMGAADVIPFIPISGVTIQDCVELSCRVAREISGIYKIPTYLYDQSARIPARRDLGFVRKGQFEGIRQEIGINPECKPDFGPCEIHPSAGATAVGARFPLIAFNIYLRTNDLKIGQKIAGAICFSNGGLRYCKALAFEIKERNQVQVSINLTNYLETPIFRVFDLVCREAERYGVPVASSEIVGFVPQKALDDCAAYWLRLENFSEEQVLGNRLNEAMPKEGAEGFIARVAVASPFPGGGSVAALAGSLAAALGEMMAGLTEGRAKYSKVDLRVREIHKELTDARNELKDLVQQDTAAYQSLMDAIKLPKKLEEEKTARAEAIEIATKRATETPLQTVRAAFRVLERLRILIEIGNPNARSDVAVGAQIACAALKGAQYNVLCNVPGLKDIAFAELSRAEAASLARRGQEILQQINAMMESS
jgi:glutamate formiminotransferase / formiminotetrahydrofolate cyclodeaminase